MPTFTEFKKAVQKQFEKLHKISKEQKGGMYLVDLDKDLIWDTYLDSFPEGTNNIYKERREYDCQCCKQFIRTVGGLVVIQDNKLTSLWDIEVGGYHQPVIETLRNAVNSAAIKDEFKHYEGWVGTDFNHQALESGDTRKWEHFYLDLPKDYVKSGDSIPSYLSEVRSNKEVLKRSLDEITLESAEIVLELIEQNSLYRGEEHKDIVESFTKHKKTYDSLNSAEKDNYAWSVSTKLGGASRIRNTVIGTLLSDISEGKPLDNAVASFESKVAPTNYKRPTALVTKGMIQKAQNKVQELGIEDSLSRRYAVTEDITINNVIYADRSAKKAMNVFDELMEETPSKPAKLDKVEEVDVDTFINQIVPKAESIEVMLENKHINNMMSLIAPTYLDAVPIFKWGNNFSWTYNGEVADSLRDKVAKAGGRVDGVLRFSHTWNYDGCNQSLMDLHVFLPNSGYKDRNSTKEVHETYPTGPRVGWNQLTDFQSGGVQDVDFVNPPGDSVPVENITFPNLKRMPEGTYIFKIHNWCLRQPTRSGFKAEIEFGGEVHQYEYKDALKHHEWITLAEVTLKNGEFSIKHILKPSTASQQVWGVTTEKFQKVKMIMNSPNHWDGNKSGNKHWFFIMDKCYNDKKARGFYNEFLKEDLKEHRKVFEVLSSKMKTEESEDQLSGLGFSSTQRNSAYFKVTGKFTRTIKVNF